MSVSADDPSVSLKACICRDKALLQAFCHTDRAIRLHKNSFKITVLPPMLFCLLHPHYKERGGQGIAQQAAFADHSHGDQPVFCRSTCNGINDMPINVSVLILKKALITAGSDDRLVRDSNSSQIAGALGILYGNEPVCTIRPASQGLGHFLQGSKGQR